MTSKFRLIGLCFAALLPLYESCPAQTPTGTPPFSSTQSGAFDRVDLATLNVSFDIPIFSRLGREADFPFALRYNSTVWNHASGPYWQPATNWGFSPIDGSALTGYVVYTAVSTCFVNGSPTGYNYQITKYVDPSGTSHYINGNAWVDYSATNPGCNGGPGKDWAVDSSGWQITLYVDSNGLHPTATSRSGWSFQVPVQYGSHAASITTTNGNQISTADGTAFVDTLGTTALSVSGIAPNPVSLTYKDTTGTSRSAILTYAQYHIHTHLGVPTSTSTTLFGTYWIKSHFLTTVFTNSSTNQRVRLIMYLGGWLRLPCLRAA